MKKQKSCYIQQVVSPFFMIYSVSCLLWESIYLLIGRPRPPRFTSEAIGYRPHSYNITWTTDSYEPISEYKLLYRRSDVSYCSLSVFRFQCYPLSFFTRQSWQHCTIYVPDSKILIFVCFRDYLWQNGSKLMKILEIGKQSLYLFPHLCHNFLSKLPILWKIWTQELSMTLLPKPKISMAGHKCPKCSTSSIKELVSILFLSVSAPPLYLDDTVSWSCLQCCQLFVYNLIVYIAMMNSNYY